ncbi:MAG: ATP-binding protein, partial [Spirochaetales bacterium]|nr:ATP-binding protein [Spirochaetales bacterium]
EIADLKDKYTTKIKSFEEKIRKAEQAVAREKEQAKQQKLQTAISFGTTILNAFLGRKAVSASTLGRATTAVRGASRTLKESGDISRAKETVEAYQAQLKALEESFEAEADALAKNLDPMNQSLTTLVLQPYKKDIQVKEVVFAWLPFRRDPAGNQTPAWS